MPVMIIKSFKIDEEQLLEVYDCMRRLNLDSRWGFSKFVRRALKHYCKHVMQKHPEPGPRIRVLDVFPVNPKKRVVVA